jgi:hypothetical protein
MMEKRIIEIRTDEIQMKTIEGDSIGKRITEMIMDEND